MGKKAQAYKTLINNGHYIIECPHPASELYSPGSGFIGSGIFRKCNYYLENIGKEDIQW